MNIFYLISKMSCNKSGSQRVPIQHYFIEKIGIERKINEYLLFDQQNVLRQIWQAESTNTALFDEKVGIERKINEYLLFDKQNVLQQIWQAESTNTALFYEKIGIERKINEYLPFDQQNVLQQIWQAESTNTALFYEKIGIERKINEIFYLISKMSCNKSGSQRVPIQHYFMKKLES